MESVHRSLGERDSGPWYRQLWPWILIALPGSVVIASLATVWIAVHQRDSLVVDDYYRQGLAINRVLDRDAQARERGLMAQGTIDLDGGRVTLRLTQRSAPGSSVPRPLPPVLRLVFYHPTLARHDRVALLERDPVSGAYRGVLERRDETPSPAAPDARARERMRPSDTAGSAGSVHPALYWNGELTPAVRAPEWRLTGRFVLHADGGATAPHAVRLHWAPAGDGVAPPARF